MTKKTLRKILNLTITLDGDNYKVKFPIIADPPLKIHSWTIWKLDDGWSCSWTKGYSDPVECLLEGIIKCDKFYNNKFVGMKDV